MRTFIWKHSVRFERYDLGNGVVLVCPHGGDRLAYSIHVYSGGMPEAGMPPELQMVGRRKAAAMLSADRARRRGPAPGSLKAAIRAARGGDPPARRVGYA